MCLDKEIEHLLMREKTVNKDLKLDVPLLKSSCIGQIQQLCNNLFHFQLLFQDQN